MSSRFSTGFLFALQTDSSYLGHGYGTLVAKYVTKKIAETGHDIYAGIYEENQPSRRLFEKLGFKSVGKVHRIETIPKDVRVNSFYSKRKFQQECIFFYIKSLSVQQ